MESEIIQIFPVEKTVTPTLQFRVKFTLAEEEPAILGVSGHLVSASSALLAPLFELNNDCRDSVQLRTRSEQFNSVTARAERYVSLGATLGPKELDHLEDLRAKDPKTDVHLRLRMTVRYLISGAMALRIGEGQLSKFAGSPAAAPGGPATTGRTMSLMHEPQGNGFLVQKAESIDASKRIAGTDWLKDFAPKLGIGSFAVLEIPDVSAFMDIADGRMQKAIGGARKAADLMRAGEWESVCEELRHVWETLRDFPLVQDALVKDGYSQEAAGLLNSALKDLFNLASKFVHSLDHDKSVLPELQPRKEDAYLVFSTTMAALNLIARKAQRAGRKS